MLAAGLFFAGIFFPQEIRAQGNSASDPRARDSIRVLKRAKSAEADFESRRRFLAPVGYDGHGAACEHIGRFCLYHTGVPLSRIPDEPDETARARLQLLAALANAAAASPNDGWITGQRVRYLIEAGEDSFAFRVAGECSAQRWWCVALRGLVHHTSGRTVAAEAAFDSALSLMPPATRCNWTDLSLLLDDQSLNLYKKLDCIHRESANRRIWWLANPLYSREGNDRRAEHFARRTWVELERQATNGFSVRWGGDLEEMILRFGRTEKWTRDAPSTMSYGTTGITGHEPEPNYHFLSKARFDLRLSAIGDSSWDLTEPMPREAYAPRYARTFTRMDPQIARFLRAGDSMLVVAAYDVSGDTTWSPLRIRAAVAISVSDSTAPIVGFSDSRSSTGTLKVRAPSVDVIAAVELLALDSSAAGRWRSAMPRISDDAGGLAISDMLLFDATDSLAADLDGALATGLGRLVLHRGRKTGVYWELYGVSASDSTLPISLTLTPASAGILRRAIRALGIGQRPSPINIRWNEPPPAGIVSARSVLLDLSLVPAGKYELSLQVGGSRSVTRLVQVR